MQTGFKTSSSSLNHKLSTNYDRIPFLDNRAGNAEHVKQSASVAVVGMIRICRNWWVALEATIR